MTSYVGESGDSSEIEIAASEVEIILDELLPLPDGPEKILYEAMRYAVLAPGKRIRPVMVLASSSLFDVDKQSSLRVAAAVEFIHSYSLVHDDLPCMDNDDLRRGQPSTHIKFDEGTAVLVGDSLIPLAFEVIAHPNTHADPKVRSDLVYNLSKAVGGLGMAGGQAIDMSTQEDSVDLGTITRLQQLKTGALISFACESGAILASAPSKLRHALHAFAHDLGLAFQISDDLLDVEGDQELLGKRVGKDIRAGKTTLVSLLGVERARTQAEILASQAVMHLDPFGKDADFLKQIAMYVIDRNK